ncbi:MAG: DUF4340 domain-containing protein [Candidatus Omnitrophica bacterium]|nr:DUF4340 domain-containing protein [Candidatus Omnitrophota bacterium]
MKLSKTLFLIFLLAGLLAYHFWTGKSSREAGAGLAPVKLLALPPGDFVTALEIENEVSKENMSLVRDESGWRLESPISSPAENFLAEGMASALTMSQTAKRFTVEDEKWKEFGFDEAQLRIGIETRDNPARRTLLLGGESPVSRLVYARWEGEKECFLVASEIKAAFDRTVYSLRQKKIFPLNWDQVTWLEAQMEGRRYRLAREGETWRWLEPPLGAEISAEKILDLIYAFRSLYVKEFLDGVDPAKRKLGLGKGENYLALGEKSGGSEKLILGSAVREKDAFYARRASEDLAVLVSRENLRSLLEALDVTFHEVQTNVDSGKSEAGSGKNPKGGPKGGKRPG